MHIVDICIELW